MRQNKLKASSHFTPVELNNCYNKKIKELTNQDCSERVLENKEHLLSGEDVLWGIPFQLGAEEDKCDVVVLNDTEASVSFVQPIHEKYLIFLHAVDYKSSPASADGIIHPMMGNPRLGEVVCEYILEYSDGSSHSVPIRRRFQINEFQRSWGENSFECVSHAKPHAIHTTTDSFKLGETPEKDWGGSQFRLVGPGERSIMHHWLYALENPFPEKNLISIRMVPRDGVVFLFGITRSHLETNPLRWESRRKTKFSVPEGGKLNRFGVYTAIELDLGAVISITPLRNYDHTNWDNSYTNQQPNVSTTEMIIEYTAHPDACVYYGEQREHTCYVKHLENEQSSVFLSLTYQFRKVTVRVVDQKTNKPVPSKIHIHGPLGEYLAPINRHRIPNPYWFEDYSTDYVNGNHFWTYIDGEAEYKLPIGELFIEVTKGFEIKPIRSKYQVSPETSEIIIQLEHCLPWRAKGWVTADTHVHFLSPQTALLEGAAEGVNVINLLASQWGEMFSNVGDFDGRTTLGSRENGGDGEYLVRVGTENRQPILGHISLIGYEGRMILPLSSDGPTEAALGDPLETTITEWARRCREQHGISILPHLPNPRAEGAASIILGEIDGVEMCSWGNLYDGISSYSLSDWYRYLNCGYQVPAVGGTDKMSADTAVGTIRTYALIKEQFTYQSWMDAVRKGLTFVTYGPLLDLFVNGYGMGSQIDLPKNGGTLDILWEAATATIPVTKIELVINGETKEVKTVDPTQQNYSGSWSVKMERSGWLALRIRGQYPGRPEVITAHSSPVMVIVDNQRIINAADALTILDQIEGCTAYISTLATKAEESIYKKLLMDLTSAHRALHHRMHHAGIHHHHNVVNDHHHH